MSTQPRRLSGRRANVAHLAWAALAIAASTTLVLVPQRGHPPPLVPLPFVALAWPDGHVAIWAVAYLAAKRHQGARVGSARARKWPVALVIVLVGTGVASVLGLAQLFGTGLQGRWYPYRDSALWLQMLAVSSAHGACLVGLLLRKSWPRFLGAILVSGWAVLLATQVTEHATSIHRNPLPKMAVVIGLLLLLVVLALQVVASLAVRSFLRR